MNRICVDSERLNALSRSLGDLRRALENQARQTSGTVTVLRQSQASFVLPACGAVSKISDELLSEAAKMQSLSEALRMIAENYGETEKRLLKTTETSDGSGAGIGAGAEDGGKLWFTELIDRIKRFFGWGEPSDPDSGETTESEETEGVTRAEEKTNDLYMQEQIFALLKTDEFSQKTWQESSLEERKAILESFMARLAAIFGVTVSSTINFFDGSGGLRGTYDYGTNKVSINENYLSRSDGYQIMQTMIHEMRHAYQHAAVDAPDSYTVSAETIAAWEENFRSGNYKSTSQGYTYSEYVSQPIEWDAKNFSKQYSDLVGADPEYVGSWDT